MIYSDDFSTTSIRQLYISKEIKFRSAGEGQHIVESLENVSKTKEQIFKSTYFYLNYNDDPLRAKLIYPMSGFVDSTLTFQIKIYQQILLIGKDSAYSFDIKSGYLEKAPFKCSTIKIGVALAFLRDRLSKRIEDTRLLLYKSDSKNNTVFSSLEAKYFDDSFIDCKFDSLNG